MTISDFLMISAVFCSPFLAIYVQSKIDLAREKRGQKLWIFRTLMATRGNRLSLDHVQALNTIELFFDRKRDKTILTKWNEYLDHFGQLLKEEEPEYAAKLNTWLDKGDDMLADLLQTMGSTLGYEFDKVKIKRGIYVPKGHGDEQKGQFFIRRGLAALFTRRTPLAVEVVDSQISSPSQAGSLK